MTYTAGRYTLVGTVPMVSRDPVAWAIWMQDFDRRIFHGEIHSIDEVIIVETSFLGVGHCPPGAGPYFFSTTAKKFGPAPGGWRPRFTATWAEAEAVHLGLMDWFKSRKRGVRGDFAPEKEV